MVMMKGEVGSEEEVVQSIMETEGSVPDTINDQHQLNPDVRLVRNIWTKGNPQERVKNVKFMSACVKGLVWLSHRSVLAAGW